MIKIFRAVLLTAATVILVTACVVDTSTTDLEGPAINITFTGGADFSLAREVLRPTTADNCAIVRGPIASRSVNLKVIVLDGSGMNLFKFTVEGEGINPSSIVVTPSDPDIRLDFQSSNFIDEIELRFLPLRDGVRNGAVVDFTIESPFTPGVTISAFAVDKFGNESRFESFELLSSLAEGRCNY